MGGMRCAYSYWLAIYISNGCLGPQYALQFILAMRSMVLHMCWFFINRPPTVCRYESSAGFHGRCAASRLCQRVEDLKLYMYLHVVETGDLYNSG
jgi:hypothetical protein